MKLVYQDAAHSYWLDGKRVKSISKVADIPADSYNVEQWGKRMVAIGITLDPSLIERVAVDLDNKTQIQNVCDDAARMARAHVRADRGTQRHRVLELTLLGQTEFITDQQRADHAVLQRTLDAYQLEPMLDRVEQFVAYPDHGVVGRYDAIMRYNGAPALFDLKGGPNAVLYPHSTLVQTALYLYAPHTSKTIVREGDRSTVTEWTTMPDGIDYDNAYVIYCDDQHEVGELWRLNMQHGYAGATLALTIVDWRKKLNYGKNAVKKIDPPTAKVDLSLADVTFTRRRAELLARYKKLGPTLRKQFRDRNLHPTDLTGIASLLDELETPPDMRRLAAAVGAVRGGAA